MINNFGLSKTTANSQRRMVAGAFVQSLSQLEIAAKYQSGVLKRDSLNHVFRCLMKIYDYYNWNAFRCHAWSIKANMAIIDNNESYCCFVFMSVSRRSLNRKDGQSVQCHNQT